MPAKPTKSAKKKTIAVLRHGDKRRNLPTAEFQEVMQEEEKTPIQVAYERRNRDLDPQLVWRGKDEQDWSDLVVHAPPLYIQEKIHPKVLIDDLQRESTERAISEGIQTPDLFADFNGLPEDARATEFYQHDANWTNRVILGDSLQAMASLAEREGLRGKVQCIYVDPPYGIRFNSNFQWSTTTPKIAEGDKPSEATREPEQVKAFRDTWRDGIHSYLTYLRDRLTAARDLLADTGSIFVQISDENVHRLKAVMDEIFGDQNAVGLMLVKKKGGQKGKFPEPVNDYLVWFAKDKTKAKAHELFEEFLDESEISRDFRLIKLPDGSVSTITEVSKRDAVGNLYKSKPLILEKEKGYRLFKSENSTSGGFRKNQSVIFDYHGRSFDPGIRKGNCWKHTAVDSEEERSGMRRMDFAGRLYVGREQLGFIRYLSDFGLQPVSNWWDGFGGASDQVYVVQTNERIVERCVLMTTDPGDLVLDPTCGSGTTAYVAEQWGRRWITIDTSRVALALARARIMGARYPYYLLADSREGQLKEAEVSGLGAAPSQATHNDLRHGFVYQRRPHITSSVVANDMEIDVIWEKWQRVIDPLRKELNSVLKKNWQEWEIPRDADEKWSEKAEKLHAGWLEARTTRQKEIDDSIRTKAEFEYLYDKPYEDKSKVRVAGPFTVESISPHRVLTVDQNENVIDGWKVSEGKADGASPAQDFASVILANLRVAGVQQAHKADKISFTLLVPWPGKYIGAEGRYLEGEGDNAPQRRAGIFIGPEFGTVSRTDLVAAAREAADGNFDVLVACAFNYDAHSAEFEKLGKIPVLKARMNPDLHMAGELKETASANLFVIFGEPDIEIEKIDKDKLRVRVKGVDVFKPQTGEVVSDGPDGIACWFIDTNYNEESFFVRHAYFLGANDPYKSLKTTLRADIDETAWESLHQDTSRPFPKPQTGRIAVKVINHLGDEVMKVFAVR